MHIPPNKPLEPWHPEKPLASPTRNENKEADTIDVKTSFDPNTPRIITLTPTAWQNLLFDIFNRNLGR